MYKNDISTCGRNPYIFKRGNCTTMRLVHWSLMVIFLFSVIFIPYHANEAEMMSRPNKSRSEGQDSSLLFSSEIPIYTANNTTLLREINIIDTDRNSRPEIAIQKPGVGGGIFIWEHSNKSFILKTKITPTAYYNPFYIDMRLLVTDLQLDGWFDIINNLYRISGGKNSSFSQNITLIGYGDNFYILSGIAIGDVDADGDFDIMVSNAGTASQNIVCLGPLLNINGSALFYDSSWTKGLPPYRGYGYGARDMKLVDVNGDGWLDLVTTMGNNGESPPWKHEDKAYFVWLSDGHGNWTNASTGFPYGDPTLLIVGFRVDLMDYDNDGDMDIFMTFLNGSWDTSTNVGSLVIYRNDGHARWRNVGTPYARCDDISFALADVDGDGNGDFAVYYEKDGKNVLEVNLGDGDGNWTRYRICERKSPHTNITSVLLEDVNLDGMLDIITNNGTAVGCWLNNMTPRHKLRFREGFEGRVFRGGMVTEARWLAAGEGGTFNLSISVSGRDGPYYRLKSGVRTRMVYWRVPDVPTENGYLRLEWRNYSVVSGPFRIIGRDDSRSLVEILRPEEGETLVEGDDVNITVRGYESYAGGEVRLKLYVNGSCWGEIGRVEVGGGEERNVSWRVPDDIFSLNCTVVAEFVWRRSELNSSVGPIGIIPESEAIGRVEVPRLEVGRGEYRIFEFYVYSRTGKNLTDVVEYEYEIEDAEVAAILSEWRNQIEVAGYELGRSGIWINVSYLGVEEGVYSELEVVESVERLEVKMEGEGVHVGAEVEFYLWGVNKVGGEIDFSGMNVSWEVTENLEIVWRNGSRVRVRGVDVGEGRVDAVLRIGEREYRSYRRVEVESFFSVLRLEVGDEEVIDGEEFEVNLRVVDYGGNERGDVEVEWMLRGPGEVVEGMGMGLRVRSVLYGVINITCRVRYLGEERELFAEVLSLPRLDRLELPGRVEVEEFVMEEFEIGLVDELGGEYGGEYEVYVEGGGVEFSVSVRGLVVEVYGKREGRGEINITVRTPVNDVSGVVEVEVYGRPESIDVEGYRSILMLGERYRYNLTVRDGLGRELREYEFYVEEDGGVVEVGIGEGYVEVKGVGVGEGYIRMRVIEGRYVLWRNESVRVVERLEGIEVEGERRIYTNRSYEYVLRGLDRGGESIEEVEWEVYADEGVDVELEGGVMRLVVRDAGEYEVRVVGRYYGQEEVEVLELEVMWEPYLYRVEVEVEGRLVRVYAYDQYGGNLTEECSIRYRGDYEELEKNVVKVRGGRLEIEVEYGGREIRKVVEVKCESEGKSTGIYLIIGISIVVGVATVYFLYCKGWIPPWRKG